MHEVLTAHAPDFILMVDRAGTILFANKTVAPLSVSEVVGKSWFEYIPRFEQERVAAALEQVFETGRSVVIEQQGLGEGGGQAWYGTHIGPVRKDGVVTA